MQKTQFTFGNSNENLKGMKGAQSLYSTGIDAQAKVGGPPAQPSNLKQSNFVLGAMQGSNTSEAHEKFKSIRDDNARAQNKAQAFQMIDKLKTSNITFKEQKRINNYFESTQKQNFRDQGYCRRVIPEEQKADNRSAHYSLGFDQPFKAKMNQTFEFKRDSRSQTCNTNMPGDSLAAASRIASQQKTVHITVGGAPSYQRST